MTQFLPLYSSTCHEVPSTTQAVGSARNLGARGLTLRALAILETLAKDVSDVDTVAKLGDALLPLLGRGGGGGRGGRAARQADAESSTRTLSVLAELWRRLAAAEDGAGQTLPGEVLQGYAETLAGLSSSMSGRNPTAALVSALEARGGIMPEVALTAELLGDLTAMSTTQVRRI
jgi:hypothetical protein